MAHRRFHPHKPKKCSKTGKTMFKTEQQASYAMMRTWAHDSRMDIYKYHTYRCPDCNQFHFGDKTKYEKVMATAVRDTVSIQVD